MTDDELDAAMERARSAIDDFPGLNACATDALRLAGEALENAGDALNKALLKAQGFDA